LELKIKIIAPKLWKNVENVAPFAESCQNAAPFACYYYGGICEQNVNYGENCEQIMSKMIGWTIT
jgi:hypothetical protein